jgi:hypothetical protein
MQTSTIIWAMLAAGAVASLAVIVRTKWLQTHTLPKCVLLSVVLHAVVAAVCTCLGGQSPASWGQHESGRMTMLVVMAEEATDDGTLSDTAESPPVLPADEQAIPDEGADAPQVVTDTESTPVEAVVSEPLASQEVIAPPLGHVPLLELASAEDDEESTESTEPVESEQSVVANVDADSDAPTSDTLMTDAPPAPLVAGAAAAPRAVPAVYADRVAGIFTPSILICGIGE